MPSSSPGSTRAESSHCFSEPGHIVILTTNQVALTMELISSLKTFLRVSETGSFSAVAAELGVAPSIVSRQLSALEEHLGTCLIHRSTRAISVTEEGRGLIPFARQTLDAVETLQHSVHRHRNVPSGRVRLGIPMALGLQLSPHLAGLLDRYEEISIDLILHDNAKNLIEAGLDLDVRIGPIADSSLITRRLGSATAYLVAAPGYLRDRALPKHPRDLLGHDCIACHDWQVNNVWRFSSPEGELAVTVSGRVRANNTEAVRRAAVEGLGIALLTQMEIDGDIREGRLWQLLPDFPPLHLPLSVVYPSRRNLPLRTRVVLEFLFELFKTDTAMSARRRSAATAPEYATDQSIEKVFA
jgi:DNA-binding transcriptional LysR family regulator